MKYQGRAWSRYSEKAFANRPLPGYVELISRIALDSAVKVAGRSDVGSPQREKSNTFSYAGQRQSVKVADGRIPAAQAIR